MGTLRVEKLTFHHRGPFSFTVPGGSCLALSGPSGAGKTLLLRTLADLEPHTGQIFLADRESRTLPAPQWRRLVAMLPAESQWWHDTVGEHFAAGNSAWLTDLGFTPEVMDWSVTRLSSGEKQRLALLRLLVGEPEVLLLDEPTANLDPARSRQVEKIISAYRERKGAAVVWVTHDPALPARVADVHYRLAEDGSWHRQEEER